jgi:2-iminoacetate synthase ThiH
MTKKRKTPQVLVPVYFNPDALTEIAKDAAEMKFRPVLLQSSKQKEHGFADEIVYQRKGIGRMLKYCWNYWKQHEAERLTEKAKLAQDERELLEKKKKLGMI